MEKQYLYHFVPKDLEGAILYPLNTLKGKYPELYQKKANKYLGREKLMEQKIPILNCLWNDVLHFIAVHPLKVKNALAEAGKKDMSEWSVYQVDPDMLEAANTVVYLYAHTNEDEHWAESNFAPYHPAEVDKYSVIPQVTRDYYKKMLATEKRPLFFHRIPHILYRGSLNVANLPILKV